MQQLQQSGYNDAQLYDPTETSVRGIHAFFLILGEPEAYGLPPKPQVPTIYLKSAWTAAFATAIASIIATLLAFAFFITDERTRASRKAARTNLREKAGRKGVVPGRGVDVAGGPIPRKPGYYGQPVVKPPVWTWEIPLYFFFGGIGRDVGGDRARRRPVSSCRSCARGHVARGHRWRSPFANSSDHGSWSSRIFSSTCCAFSNIDPPCRWARGF